MEDLIDDDFGSIYADVEVKASYAINSLSNLAKLNTEEEAEEGCKNDNVTEGQVNAIANVGNLVSGSDSKQLNSICEKLCNSEGDGSDSEDDLNIVLNDEGCQGFSVAAEGNGNRDGRVHEDGEDEGYTKNGLNPNANHGAERVNGLKGNFNNQYLQYKHVKPYGPSFPINKNVNESLVFPSSSKSARGDLEDNGCKQQKISNVGQVSDMRGAANSIISHGGCGFSLPRNRTILDVNIDAFEEKRWRCHGVDLSDFFNFGFDEDSWKQYCISLEQCRQYSYICNRFPNHEPSKLTQAYEIGLEDKRAAQDTIVEDIAQSEFSSKSAELVERQLGLPKGRAIQVEGSTAERQPTMNFRRPRIWDSDVVIQINVQDFDKNSLGSGEEEFHHANQHGVSKSRDLYMADIKDVHYSGSASADESSAKTLGNIKSSSTNRSSQPISQFSEISLVPDNQDKDQTSSDDNNKVNARASEVETVEKVGEENGMNTCKSDQCATEMELSVGDLSHFSLTPSCFGSDSDSSTDSRHCISEVSDSPLRRQSSGTMLQEPVAYDRKCSESSGTVRKLDSRQHCSRKRYSSQAGRRHQNRKLHRVPERRIHPPTGSDAFPMSRDQRHDRCRYFGRSHDFDCDEEENLAYDRQRKFCSYGGERFADNHIQDVCSKHPHRKYHQNFRDEMKQREKKNWNEGNLHERSFRLDDRDDWDYGGRGLCPEGRIPPTCRESRRLVSKYNNFKETDIHWRMCNKIQSGKKTNHDACSPDHEILDDLMLQKCGRSIPITNRKRGSLDEKHGSHIPFIGREANLYGGRVRCCYRPPVKLQKSWCMETEDEHWDLDKHRLSSQFHRESDEANEGRLRDLMLPRSSMFHSRLAETCGRHRRDTSGDKCMDNHWPDNYNDIDDAEDEIIYIDEQVALQRKKYSWQSGMLHQMQGESLLRHRDDGFDTERSSYSYEKSFRHERTHVKYRSANDWMVVDDIQLEWHRCKMFKGEGSACFLNRKPDMMNRCEHRRMASRCSDPVDLICGGGKSSGRHSTTECLMSHGKFRKMDLKFTEEHEMAKDFNETQSGKATQTGISRTDGSWDDEKWLDKFPVAGHHQNVDIEEGQIVPEERVAEDRLGKKHASGRGAPLRNMKKNFLSQNVRNGTEMKGYDDQQILDTIAKMERRMERFKDPVAQKKEPDKILKLPVDLVADKVETKQDRPVRKRRWGGS